MGKDIAKYPLDWIRVAREPRPQKKSFVPLDGHSLGLEINWKDEEVRYFLYKDKRKNVCATSEWVSFYAGEKKLRAPLHDLVADYFKKTGRGPLSDYAKMELNIPVGHLHYHIWAGTLQRAFQKEVIYN